MNGLCTIVSGLRIEMNRMNIKNGKTKTFVQKALLIMGKQRQMLTKNPIQNEKRTQIWNFQCGDFEFQCIKFCIQCFENSVSRLKKYKGKDFFFDSRLILEMQAEGNVV